MKTLQISIITIVLFAFSFLEIFAQTGNKSNLDIKHKHSIDICPLSPLFNIWAVHYSYKLTPKDELITGLSYMNIQFEGVGSTHSPALILGYRRYIWKNLHVEYEIWPAYDDFWEQNERKYYSGFDLWNEFRLGYLFNFNIGKAPMYLNLQWPFGFGLYASNKPESFKEFEKDNRFFYFPPLFFLGFRF